MLFNLFAPRAEVHLRKAQEYLDTANCSRLEHHLAAAHHSALASMYAQRVAWLEQEMIGSTNYLRSPLSGVVSTPVEGVKRNLESIVNITRSH